MPEHHELLPLPGSPHQEQHAPPALLGSPTREWCPAATGRPILGAVIHLTGLTSVSRAPSCCPQGTRPTLGRSAADPCRGSRGPPSARQCRQQRACPPTCRSVSDQDVPTWERGRRAGREGGRHLAARAWAGASASALWDLPDRPGTASQPTRQVCHPICYGGIAWPLKVLTRK